MWLVFLVCFLLIEPVLLSPHPDCGGRACGSAHHKFNAADGDAADGAIVTPTAIAGNRVLAGGKNRSPPPPSSGSCIGKCHHSYVYTWNCQCNDGCKIYNDCCSDYTAVCSDVPPPPPPPPPP